MEKSPKEAKAIFDALAEAQKYIAANHDETYAIAKKRFANADAEVLKSALEHMYKVFSPDGKFSHANVDQTQKISVDHKIMPKFFPYDDAVASMVRK